MATVGMTLAERVRRVAEAAVKVEADSGFPAEIIGAQAGLESAWLASAPGNNPFGWKSSIGALPSKRQLLKTTEVLTDDQLAVYQNATDGRALISRERLPSGLWRCQVMDFFDKFDSLSDAFHKHAYRLMHWPRYAPSWKRYVEAENGTRMERITDLVKGIAKAGYATDLDYAGKVTLVAFSRPLRPALDTERSLKGIRL